MGRDDDDNDRDDDVIDIDASEGRGSSSSVGDDDDDPEDGDPEDDPEDEEDTPSVANAVDVAVADEAQCVAELYAADMDTAAATKNQLALGAQALFEAATRALHA